MVDEEMNQAQANFFFFSNNSLLLLCISLYPTKFKAMRSDSLLLASVVVGTIAPQTWGYSSPKRLLQQGLPPQSLNYQANYSAGFQYLSHALCDGPPPLLTVTCSGKMILLNTSDVSIQCDKLQEPVIENGTSYECRNTCVGSDCENVYHHYRDVFDPIKGPFGSIYFLCE
jgi:hypothetical protein